MASLSSSSSSTSTIVARCNVCQVEIHGYVRFTCHARECQFKCLCEKHHDVCQLCLSSMCESHSIRDPLLPDETETKTCFECMEKRAVKRIQRDDDSKRDPLELRYAELSKGLRAKLEFLYELLAKETHISDMYVELRDQINRFVDERAECQMHMWRLRGLVYTPTDDEQKQIQVYQTKLRELRHQQEELRIRHILEFGDALSVWSIRPTRSLAEAERVQLARRLTFEIDSCILSIVKLQRDVYSQSVHLHA